MPTILLYIAIAFIVAIGINTYLSYRSYKNLDAKLETLPKLLKSGFSSKQAPELSVNLSSSHFQALSDYHLRLINRMLSTLKDNPPAYFPDKHNDNIIKHCLVNLKKCLVEKLDPEYYILAVAKELGHSTAWKADGTGNFTQIKNVGKESYSKLISFDEFSTLTPSEKSIIVSALLPTEAKTGGAVADLRSSEEVTLKAEDVVIPISEFVGSQPSITTASKVNIDKKAAIDSQINQLPKEQKLAIEVFLDALPNMPFKSRSLQKGKKAVGYKLNTKLFLFEIGVREACMAELEKSELELYKLKSQSVIHPFSQALFSAFENLGWLTSEIEVEGEKPMKCVEGAPLWTIKAGDLEFKAIFIIDLPSLYSDKLPKDDASYPIQVLRPQFVEPKKTTKVDNELQSLMFK